MQQISINAFDLPFLVVGAGSWGTALAVQACRVNSQVILWGRDTQLMQAVQATRYHQRYFPYLALPHNLQITGSWADVPAAVQTVLIAVPSYAFKAVLHQLRAHFINSEPTLRCIIATKGFDLDKKQWLHETFQEIFPEVDSYAFLSGPSFAGEVMRNLPTAVVMSAAHESIAISMRSSIHGEQFRVYTNQDMIGTQFGAAVKNVMAIAAGMSDGLGFGANARAALITRGLSEITRMGMALGGKASTFMGLAGLGDLVLTCTDNQSRNRRFGLGLASGQSINEVIRSIGQAVEGIHAAQYVHSLSQTLQIEMPILQEIYAILHDGKEPKEAVSSLLARDPTAEA